MSDKSPGQVAYEAFVEKRADPIEWLPWSELRPGQKVAWQSAAEAAYELGRKQGIEEAAEVAGRHGYENLNGFFIVPQISLDIRDEIRALKDKEVGK